MLIIPGGSMQLFLVGVTPPVEVTPTYPSQLKTFDVYYMYEPVIGFQVLSGETVGAALSFHVVSDETP